MTLKSDLDLQCFWLKMCRSMRYICMPNMKFLSPLVQKLSPTLKFDTNTQTNRQGKNNMPPITDLGGITKINFLAYWLYFEVDYVHHALYLEFHHMPIRRCAFCVPILFLFLASKLENVQNSDENHKMADHFEQKPSGILCIFFIRTFF